jgi:hypothetical protein
MTNLVSWWPAVVFGWPAILLALVLSVLGIARKRPASLLVSAVIATPFSLYIGSTPRVGWPGLMIPVLLLGASTAVRYRRVEIAWLFLTSVAVVIVWVASLVIRQ